MSTNKTAITPAEFLKRNEKFAATHDANILLECSKGQSPSLFWLGCSDSRVAESHVIQSALGEVFVHRNVANVYNPNDTSATAALAYAVNHLKVPHIVVVGHESCGGCAAALALAASAPSCTKSDVENIGEAAIGRWIQPILELATKQLQDKPASGLSDLVSANVCAQVSNVVKHSIITEAWARGQAVSVHGWVYDLGSGKLKDLGLTQTGPRA